MSRGSPAGTRPEWFKLLARSTLSPTAFFRKGRSASSDDVAPHTSQPRGALSDRLDDRPSLLPEMPLHVVRSVVHTVEFLDEHHHRELGLYRREGITGEHTKVLEILQSEGKIQHHDLAKYSPHSIAHAIKELLGKTYAPWIPYQQGHEILAVMESKGKHDSKILERVTTGLMTTHAPIREALKILLIHLHHVSTNSVCQMNTEALALHVGALLIRPDEARKLDQGILGRRRRLAQLLIENASALPYDCAAEIVLPKLESQLSKAINPIESPQKDITEECPLHYVQASWDDGDHSFTEDDLKVLLTSFGSIENLAISESKRRAIVAFRDAESVDFAVATSIPHLRLRSKKKRSPARNVITSDGIDTSILPCDSINFASRDFRSLPTPLKIQVSAMTTDKHEEAGSPASQLASPIALRSRSGSLGESFPHLESIPSTRSFQDKEHSPSGTAPPIWQILERPSSMVFMERVKQAELQSESQEQALRLEEFDSPLTSPLNAVVTVQQEDVKRSEAPELVDDSIDDTQTLDEGATVRREQDNEFSNVHTSVMPASVVQVKTTGAANNLTLMKTSAREGSNASHIGYNLVSSTQSQQSALFYNPKDLLQHVDSNKESNPDGQHMVKRKSLVLSPLGSLRRTSVFNGLKKTVSRKKLPHVELGSNLHLSAETCNGQDNQQFHTIDEETHVAVSLNPPPPPPTVNKELSRRMLLSTETQTILSFNGHPSTSHASTNTADLEESENARNADSLRVNDLEQALQQIYSILATSAQVLTRSTICTISDKAILHLHSQLKVMVERVLKINESKSTTGSDESAMKDFISFLEIQATTQVKILEAEVRAGQELLRLHKSQHAKELADVEDEVAALRLTRAEAENMCSELRSELRKCRNELSCHIATSATLQRDKREAEEKVVNCENQLRAKDLKLCKVLSKYDEMEAVAAQAQMRVEAYRSNEDKCMNDPAPKIQSKTTATGGLKVHETSALPKTTAFLTLHQQTPIPSPGHTMMNRFAASTLSVRSNQEEESTIEENMPGQHSNVEHLVQMKQSLKSQIQKQISTTRTTLKDLYAFGDDRALEEERATLHKLQAKLETTFSEMNGAMDESRQKLEMLEHPVVPPTNVDQSNDNSSSFTDFDPQNLVQHLLAMSETTETCQEYAHTPLREENERDQFMLPAVLTHPTNCDRLRTGKRTNQGQQSELYKKWLAGRGEKSRAPRAPRTFGDNKSLYQAQQSMKEFQIALSAVRSFSHT